MIRPRPVTLEKSGLRLEPMSDGHKNGIVAAAADGELWKLWYTTVPSPNKIAEYVEDALNQQRLGRMLPWVVIDAATNKIIGSTRFHDIVAEARRVEIGYTFYAKSRQKTHINTLCKLIVMAHAFDDLNCSVVGFRTDSFNFTSQKAIEALGAKKDGVIRRHQIRKDGSIRDNVFYSVLYEEWPDVKKHLEARLRRLEKSK